jgi:hypothetical protein
MVNMGVVVYPVLVRLNTAKAPNRGWLFFILHVTSVFATLTHAELASAPCQWGQMPDND